MARAAFREATAIMDSYHTNTNVQQWTALVGDERVKVFKGEPYERAMAHYYLGLLCYADGKYDDAGACFRNALFKLKVYDETHGSQEEGSAESDFAVAWYLLARCRQRERDVENARRCFSYVREAVGPGSDWITEEKLSAETNVLLVIETGNGPYKTPYGPNAVLADLNPVFASTALRPEVWVNGEKTRDPALLVNLRSIAVRRKWQTLDTIRYVKGILSSGAAVEALRQDGEIPSWMLKLLQAALAPGVNYDMRHWEFMPDNIYMLPLSLPSGEHSMKVVYLDTRGAEHSWHTQAYSRVSVPDDRERLLWIRCGPMIEGGSLLTAPDTTDTGRNQSHGSTR